MKTKIRRTRMLALAMALSALSALSIGAAHAQELRGQATYRGAITNVNSRLCLELMQSAVQDGVRVQQGQCIGPRADWDLLEVGSGEFAIINRTTGMVMDVNGASRDDGALIQQWTWNQSGAQRWRLEAKRPGLFQIVNASGKCLDVSGASKNVGANITQYQCHGGDNQLFRFTRATQAGVVDYSRLSNRPTSPLVPPPASPSSNSSSLAAIVPLIIGGAVIANLGNQPAAQSGPSVRPPGRVIYTGMIHSRATGKCVDVERAQTGEGANIFQWSCNASAAQIWDVIDLGRGEIAFVSQASGKVMDIQGRDRRAGADVRQYSWTGTATQRWRMENAERGFSRIVNVGSGKCLDLDAARGNDGAEILQFDCHGEENQQWRMEVSGNDAEWRGYNAKRDWSGRNRAVSDEPPAFMVGDFAGYSANFQSDIQLSIYSDGIVIAAIDGGTRVTGYYRGAQLFLGNGRFDIQQETSGFRLSPTGQRGDPVSYARLRYESPRGRPER